MGDFSADWLALREPADAAARADGPTRAVADSLPAAGGVRVLDLGSGTGSNVRYLTARLPSPQDWLLVDYDAALLAQLPTRMAAWAKTQGLRVATSVDGMQVNDPRRCAHLRTRALDLRVLPADLFTGRSLVTASALLDLVSEAWLAILADRCRTASAVALFALSYDGRLACTPPEPEDERVRALVNRHQQTDKGFGAAVGPDGTACATRIFIRAGYRVERARSDWRLLPDAAELQRELIVGWADAAEAMAPEEASAIRDWRARRLAHVEAHRSEVLVGHEDLAAWL